MDHLSRIADLLLVIGPCVIFLWRWIRKIDFTVVMVRQTATEHLPFIYGRLKVHDEALNLPSPEHPPIGIVIVNGSSGSADRPVA